MKIYMIKDKFYHPDEIIPADYEYEYPMLLFSTKEQLNEYVDNEYIKIQKSGKRFYEVPTTYYGNLSEEMSSKIERFDSLEEKLSNIEKENDELRKRNAFLECEPYRGPEFFQMMKEEMAEWVIEN